MAYVVVICFFSLFAIPLTFLLLAITTKLLKTTNLPPGELGLPWIGETVQFYKAQLDNRLYGDFLRPRAEAHGPIFKTSIMGSPTVVIAGAEANRFFLSNEFKLVMSSWPWAVVRLMGCHSIMGQGPQLHLWLRSTVAASLNPAMLAPRISSYISGYLGSRWSDQDEIQLFDASKEVAFGVVCECILGMKAEAALLETFKRVLDGVFAVPLALPGSRFWRAKTARDEIGRVLRGLVRERRGEVEKSYKLKEGRENEGMLIRRMVEGLVKGEVREEEVIDNIVLLIFAAHDTTALAIAMIFRMLAHHSRCYAHLLREQEEVKNTKSEGEMLTWEDIQKMKYTWQVTRETMRLFPPIFGSFRKAIVDIEYQGFTIPKGWKVLWTTYGTHYDPQYFAEPEVFNPSRFEEPIPPYVYIPFGGGQRSCAGYQVAKLNILIFIHYMVTKYDWSLVDPHEPIIGNPLPTPSKGMPIRVSDIK